VVATNTDSTSPAPARWRFFVDRGGTFTDLVGVEPKTRALHQRKVLSSDEAPLVGIREILGLPPEATIPPCDVRLGTTLATNALLERRGRDCALIITQGFEDLLELGTGARPELFELRIVKPSVLYSEVIEVAARCDATGHVLQRPDEVATRAEFVRLRRSGLTSVAIAVMHAYANDELERLLEAWARDAGFEHVVSSSHAAREIGLLRRTQTTVLDAYLTPVLSEYLRHLAQRLPGSSLLLMQSSGRLATAEHLRGPATLLSGPAGGVVAYAQLAQLAGEKSAVGFDMGGTSTDVSRCEGELPRIYETTTAGVRVVAPMMDIHTVAAGGGSLCEFDGHTLSVGPRSAGAKPGPICYGHADAQTLTVTDINVLLGRLQPDRFPFELSPGPAGGALRELQQRVCASGTSMTEDEVASGLLDIANDNMARAITQVSVARGYDVRNDVLIVFGGAGGQHACAVARKLEIPKLLFPPFGGVLSALGMGLATRGVHTATQFGPEPLQTQPMELVEARFAELEDECLKQLPDLTRDDVAFERRIDLRYRGTEVPLTLAYARRELLRQQFDQMHAQRFGYDRPTHEAEIVALRVEATAASDPRLTQVLQRQETQEMVHGAPVPIRHERIHSGRWCDNVPVYRREDLHHGHQLVGPACILEASGTIMVDVGFIGEITDEGFLRLTDVAGRDLDRQDDPTQDDPTTCKRTASDPVTLEIMGNAFMSIAEQMGAVLARTATSTNIRERLDFSCAVFDRHSQLIANAPHIPVHLGAMGESVESIARSFPTPHEGDVYVTNDPASGGSHLPDITVVTPVFDAGQLVFYVANRGHHADVGGITPGSMPPFSSSLEEEGVVFRNVRIVHRGRFDESAVRRVLASGPYPARQPDQNVADLQAQVAANQLGSKLVIELIQTRGRSLVLPVVDELQRLAAQKVEAMLRSRGELDVTFEDGLDDGTPVSIALRIHDGHMRVRFAPTEEHVGNANAPRAVVVSAVLYVLRCLVGPGIPLNSGCLGPVEILTTPETLTEPGPRRAVCSGNVETSQRIVDVLLGALGAAAASQGTMNNLTFGGPGFSYYETLAGGAGAGPDFDGASGVQVHMTNTRMTDPEVIEARYPVRLRKFGLRRGSGGTGLHPGGDGVERCFEFLEPAQVAIVSERRDTRPFGLAGGQPGLPGENELNGKRLGGRTRLQVQTGDVLCIRTPGGGGFGRIG
jgi:5-oxoprolinase (ATP-hydrolysing)